MRTNMFVCTVSSVDKDEKTADISIPEREDTVKTDVPFLSSCSIPEIGDTVVALFEENNGRLERGYIIGQPMRE